MAGFARVASVDEIPEGTLKKYEVGYQKLVVAHTSDGFYAVVDECTHEAVPISTGQVSGNEIICARHHARFDLRTGAVTAPPAIVPLDTLELKVDGDDILVWIDD